MSDGSFEVCRGEHMLQLCSSGMDSLLLTTVALAYGNTVRPLFVDFGFPWEPTEYVSLVELHRRLAHPALQEVARIKVAGDILLGRNWIFSGEIPQWENGILTNAIIGRNACLITLAHTYAVAHGFRHVMIGFTSHSYPDTQVQFLDTLMTALNAGMGSEIELHYPMPGATTSMIQDFVAEHAEIPWSKAFSCYRPLGTDACGKCYKCTETALRRKNWKIAERQASG